MESAMVPPTPQKARPQTSRLENVPTEIIEQISENLDLPSVSNLRLTCRILTKRSAGPRYKRNFYAQTTDLSESSLARLAAIVSSPEFGPSVKHLIVEATVYYADWLGQSFMQGRLGMPPTGKEELDGNYREELEWISDRRSEQLLSEEEEHATAIVMLTDIFKKLGRLESIRLSSVVAARRGKAGRVSDEGANFYVLRRCGSGFNITTTAMARSGIQTPVFHVFGSDLRRGLPAASIGWLLELADRKQLSNVLGNLTDFGLSMAPVGGSREELWVGSAKLERERFHPLCDSPQEHAPAVGAIERGAAQALAELLTLMPNLESLDVCMYTPYRYGTTLRCRNVFANIARNNELKKLRKCTLRGIFADQESIVLFLEKHAKSIQHFEIRNVLLTEGSWAPIFGMLNTKRMPSLALLRLDSLFVGERTFEGLVNLAPKEDEDNQETDERQHQINRQYLPDSTKYQRSFECHNGLCVYFREFRGDELGEELEFITKYMNGPHTRGRYRSWASSLQHDFGFVIDPIVLGAI